MIEWNIHFLLNNLSIINPEIIIFLVAVFIQMTITSPFGMTVALPFTVGISVYFVRKWTWHTITCLCLSKIRTNI